MADSLEDAIVENEEAVQLPDSIPEMDTGRLPTAEELLKLLDGMDGLSDEDKESLRADLQRSIEGGNPFGQPPPTPFTSQALILFALLALIALIFEKAKCRERKERKKMAEVLEKIKETLNLTPELQDKFKSMMDKFKDLDDDEKAEFVETVKESFKGSLEKYKTNFLLGTFWGITQSYAVQLFAVIFILFIFVFFGYKLYKSLVERERKREEKKKLRELKKKK